MTRPAIQKSVAVRGRIATAPTKLALCCPDGYGYKCDTSVLWRAIVKTASIGCLAVVVTVLAPGLAFGDTVLERGEMRAFDLGGSSGSIPRVFLVLTGRYEAKAEAEWLQYNLFLRLNSVPLDGNRIVGSNEIKYPRYGVLVERGPKPRYDTKTRCFAFKLDNDWTVDQPPYLSDNARSATTAGYDHTLVLDVTDIVAAADNRLLVYNSATRSTPKHGITGRFVMKSVQLAHQAPQPPAAVTGPAYAPCWVYFERYPDTIDRYTAALASDAPASLKADIAAELGIYWLFQPKQQEQALEFLRKSLRYGADSPSSDQVWFHLLRATAGPGDAHLAGTAAELRAKAGDSPWTELAAAYFAAAVGTATNNLCRPVSVVSRQPTATVTVDGVLDDQLWSNLRRHELEQAVPTAAGPGSGSGFRVCSTEFGLLWAFDGPLPAADQRPLHRQPKVGAPVWEVNCFELFLDPGCRAQVYYELNVDDSGGVYNGKNRFGAGKDPDWSPSWQVAAYRTGTRFTAEYLVPWTDLGVEQMPVKGTVWGMNAVRVVVRELDGERTEEDYSWSPLRARNFHRLMDQGLLVFE